MTSKKKNYYQVYGTGDDYGTGMPDLVRAKNIRSVRKLIKKSANVFKIKKVKL